MKITTIDTMYLSPEHKRELEKIGEFSYYPNYPKNDGEAITRCKDSDIIINFWYKMPQPLFDSLPKLKYIVVAAVGYEWVDMNAAKSHKIQVSNCPGHNGEAVAEHSIGLMLSAARFSFQSVLDLKKGLWENLRYKGKELKGKTLGIVGFGFIGRRVAEIAHNGLGMNIQFINSKSDSKELESILKESDVISVNTPLNESTRNLLSHREFDLMKPGVIIVNTGRGAVINQEALIDNLKSGKIFAAGLDVFANEPIKKGNKLLSFTNVICTPHMAWNTEETEIRLSEMVVENIKNFIHGTPIHLVS